jgi:dolichol-phosphate mannosyltransferase
MNNKPSFSIISPVYGAAKILHELVDRINQAVLRITDDYEIILVEDNSPDNSWEIIESLSKQNPKVKGLRLSRNFGQQYALAAGFDHARGDWVVTIDCDLQDDPAFIYDLYSEALNNYDVVFASRKNRQDGIIKKLGSRVFYAMLGYLTDTIQDHSIANFILYRRTAVDAMAKIGDFYRYYPMLNKWIGFKTIKKEIPHSKRVDGKKSSYSMRKRIALAFTTIIAFSDKPLRIVLKVGLFLVLLSTIFAIVLIVMYFVQEKTVSGWLSVFVSIWFFYGIIISILGLIGTYIGKIFETVKRRPTYLISQQTNSSHGPG